MVTTIKKMIILWRKRVYHSSYLGIPQNSIKLMDFRVESHNAQEFAETSSEMNEDDCFSPH